MNDDTSTSVTDSEDKKTTDAASSATAPINNTQSSTENIYINTDKNDGADPKENTRTYIAQLYVWAFFIVVGVVFFIGLVNCFSVNEYKDMLVTVSGVLSGPLGFIVGYYFKASKE